MQTKLAAALIWRRGVVELLEKWRTAGVLVKLLSKLSKILVY